MAAHVWELMAELIAPTRCAACDQPVARRAVFCEACSVGVVTAAGGARAVFDYGGPVADAIMRFKYGGRSDLGPRLGALLAELAIGDASAALVEIVVPVPLHPRRVVERGFDQAALLSKPVARRLGVPWGVGVLARTRETPKQANLDRARRRANVAAAFEVARPAAIAGRNVLLVDDVRTTGATLEACANALSERGARVVTSIVMARRGDA